MEKHKKTLIVFDFDGTLYKKDASKQFCLFFYKKRPLFIWFAAFQMLAFLCFKLGFIKTGAFKRLFFGFIALVPDQDLKELMDSFWEQAYPKDFYSKLLKHAKDKKNENILVCISASPSFLIQKPCEQIGMTKIIGTNILVQKKKVRLMGKNMRGQEKIKALENLYGKSLLIDEAYSDNKDDWDLLLMAKKGYVVSKGTLRPIKQKKAHE